MMKIADAMPEAKFGYKSTPAHTMDIYGQMAVYLRLNGIVPPASRGA